MNKDKLIESVKRFITKQNSDYYQEEHNNRKEREKYYQLFTKERLLSMNEDDFYEYISKLWSMIIWGNKKYVVDKLIEDNGFISIKKEIVELLFGSNKIESRWNNFLKNVKGLGPSIVSELLSYNNPNEYVIFNKTTILCFTYLEIQNMPKYNYQYTGQKYIEICNFSKEI